MLSFQDVLDGANKLKSRERNQLLNLLLAEYHESWNITLLCCDICGLKQIDMKTTHGFLDVKQCVLYGCEAMLCDGCMKTSGMKVKILKGGNFECKEHTKVKYTTLRRLALTQIRILNGGFNPEIHSIY